MLLPRAPNAWALTHVPVRPRLVKRLSNACQTLVKKRWSNAGQTLAKRVGARARRGFGTGIVCVRGEGGGYPFKGTRHPWTRLPWSTWTNQA